MCMACCVSNDRADKLDCPDSSRISRPPPSGKLGVADLQIFGGCNRILVGSKSNIWDDYSLESDTFGQRKFGTVTRAVPKSDTRASGSGRASGPVRAVKSIGKRAVMDGAKLRQEIAIMRGLDHPNVALLTEFYEDAWKVYLVMELCSGGELFDRIAEVDHLTEKQASAIMQQAVRAVNYMHERRVVHRDLKPENFLFAERAALESSTLKIIDFGLSRSFVRGEVLTTFVGTPLYVSPQVLSRRYDMSCDVWSLGVITYVLLCGYPPFQAQSDEETLALVARGRFQLDADDWAGVSEDAKDLIRAMLQLRPTDRPTALQALTHDWLRKRAPRARSGSLGPGLLSNLRMFRSQHQLKKAALQIVASRLDLAQILGLSQTLARLDADRDGLLSVSQLREGMEASELKELPADFLRAADDARCDGAGVIDLADFVAAAVEHRLSIQEDTLWSVFRVFDREGGGKIAPQDLRRVLCDARVEAVLDPDTVYQLMKAADGESSGGEVDFDEIVALMAAQR